MTIEHAKKPVIANGQIQCLPDRNESIEKCRFCVHSVSFIHNGVKIPSPAREFCVLSKKSDASKQFDLSKVSVVFCDDTLNEGFRSIMNIIG